MSFHSSIVPSFPEVLSYSRILLAEMSFNFLHIHIWLYIKSTAQAPLKKKKKWSLTFLLKILACARTLVITLPWPQLPVWPRSQSDHQWPFKTPLCHDAFQEIYNICQIQPFLTRDSAQVLVRALVISRLDPLSAWLPVHFCLRRAIHPLHHFSKFLQVTLVLTTIWRIRQEVYPLPPGNGSTLYSSIALCS